MPKKLCYKCKVQSAIVNVRNWSCYDCFTSYIENNLRKEIRTKAIDKLKKLNRDHLIRKPPKSKFYVALGFGYSSQVLLKLLTVIPNSEKRPDFGIESFLNVDTSCLFNRDPKLYYDNVRSFIELNFKNNFYEEDTSHLPKLEIIPFCSSFAAEDIKNKEEIRSRCIDIIKYHISRGTDHIKLLIQLIIYRDIKYHLDNSDDSRLKSLIIASSSDSMASESLQYLTLASGLHTKSIYQYLDFRWRNESSTLILIRPLRNLHVKEIMLYWKYCVSNNVFNSIGAEISMNRSSIEDEIYKFILSQNDKVSNISNIFLRLNGNSRNEHYCENLGIESTLLNCRFCGLVKKKGFTNNYCVMCNQLLETYQLLKLLK